MSAPHEHPIDALLPPEMATRAESIGISKAARDTTSTFVLAVLAGAFIALGANASIAASAGLAGAIPFGLARLVAGVVFSLGLVLVIVGGAELFTGNNLVVMAWAAGSVPLRRLLRNWAVVYAGNLVGALGTAAIVFVSEQHTFGHGAVGAALLASARAKCSLGFAQAIALGALCNALVCLAVWLAFSARTTTDRVVAIVPPVAAFVIAGFEHSIANMYVVPLAILVRELAPPAFWAAAGVAPGDYAALDVGTFVARNLVPVTIGNVLGGGGLVGLVYWFVYLRKRPRSGAAQGSPS